VPVATLRHVVDLLRTHGTIRRGYLGVRTQPVHLPAVLQERVGQDTGLLVITVEPHSPAEQGHLLLGDVLMALDETPLRHPDDLLAYLSSDRIGARVRVRLVRGGQVQEQTVLVGERL
jgi:S1-C subfamily serine protease